MTVLYEKFLEAVSGHEMTIENDTGVHRSIVFRNPRDSELWFRIVTWPGHLAISGDTSSFMFERIEDMFHFFKIQPGQIRTEYWAEKLVAHSVQSGHRAFCWDKFVLDLTKECQITASSDTLSKEELDEKVKAQVELLCATIENDEYGAVDLIRNWSFQVEAFEELSLLGKLDPYSSGFMEYGFKGEFTYHFQWCLHAIVWAIQQYNLHKGGTSDA